MKITYNPEIDVLKINFKDTSVTQCDRPRTGVAIEYDINGDLVGIEILNASLQLENPYALEYAVTHTNKLPEIRETLSCQERREFMQLSIAERRRILAEQAQTMIEHYQQNREWQELLAGDIVDY